MVVGTTMSKNESQNVGTREVADSVSDETSSSFAFLTGLIGSMRNSRKIFRIGKRRFSVHVDSVGDMTVTPLPERESTPNE